MKQKMNSNFTLVKVINDTGAKNLTLEEQKQLLIELGLLAVKELLIFNEHK